MNKKVRWQLWQDLGLAVLISALFGYHLWEEPVHEWLGLAFLALIIAHISLNSWWLKKLLSGSYDGFRLFKTGLNLALFVLFCTACITGVLLSKHIFDEFFFHSTADEVRKLHMLSTHWLQIIGGVHLGLHWQPLATMLENRLRLNLDEPSAKIAGKILLPIMWGIISAYGIYAFIERDLLPYLLNQVNFAFFDYDESPLRFYFDFFAIFIACAYFTRFLLWLCVFRRK